MYSKDLADRRHRLLSWGWVALLAIAAALPAAAQQTQPSTGLSLLPPAPLSLAYPTEIGRPVIYGPRYIANADRERHADCIPAPCRLRLLGVIRKNGAVAVEGTAFSW